MRFNKLKNYLLVAGAISLSFYSCKKENVSNPNLEEVQNENESKLKKEARTAFSKILSKAIYAEPSLRKFIKNIALEQFDNDYDVFYPFVKDQSVDNNETFRSLLLKYADSEESFEKIEEILPLLNIYVPDLRLVSDFSAESWDVNDKEIAVTAHNYDEDQLFYENGKPAFTLKKQEIPGFACLVIKDNERLKEKIKLKGISSINNYEFIDDVFDKKIKTKGTIEIDGIKYVYNDKNIVSPDKIIEDAFNEFGTDPVYWQRDYIYWGMTKNKPKNGAFNPHIREFIHKIRINPSLLTTISDQPSDPRLTSFEHKSDSKDPVSWSDIVKRVWTDGNFELRFLIHKGKRNESSNKPDTRTLNVSPRDLFTLKKVKHTVKKGGIFHRDKHTYMVESINDLEGKWITPNLQLEQWDISQESVTMTIAVEEFDPSDTYEKELTISNKYVNSANFKIDLGLGNLPKKLLKLDLSFGASAQKEETKTDRTKWTSTRETDFLGNVTFYYSDPVLKIKYNYNNPSVKIFDAYSTSTGSIDIMLLPKAI